MRLHLPGLGRSLAVAFATIALAACSGGGGGGSSSTAPACSLAADCQAPAAGTCLVATCTAGVCGTASAAAGTPLPDPTPGDCKKRQCNGTGQAVLVPDDADVPAASGPCTTGLCNAGTPLQADVAAGTACPAGLCDAGACVACLTATDCGAPATCTAFACTAGACTSGNQPPGTPCGSGLTCDGAGTCTAACASPADCPGADTECRVRTCAGTRCGVSNVAAGTVLGGQTAGDCKRRQCDGAGNVVSVPDAADLPDDGNPCTAGVCNNGTPSNVDLPAGAICPTGACQAGACVAPSCSDNVKNGDETDVDCGGNACPACPVSRSCAVNTDCASALCFEGTCRADVNGCSPSTATDLTGQAAPTVTFPSGLAFAYSPACLKVTAGTAVTFSGTFLFHPLQGGLVLPGVAIPAVDGPFAAPTNTGTTATFTMGATGTFPFYCTVHGVLANMAGAVFVLPPP